MGEEAAGVQEEEVLLRRMGVVGALLLAEEVERVSFCVFVCLHLSG